MLLPNQRMLGLYLARHGDAEPGRDVFIAPAAEVFSVWVQRTAFRIDLLRGEAVPASASAMQVQLAWQRAVRESEPDLHAPLVHHRARQARSADRLIRQWYAASPPPWLDARFLDWRRRAAQRLRDNGWFTPEDWLQHLTARLERAELPAGVLPERLELKGFIELTRLEQGLLDALQRHGVDIVDPRSASISAKAAAAVPEVREFPSPEQEVRAAVAWAREQLAQGRRRVALVVNGIDALRDDLEAALDRALRTQGPLHAAADGDGPYHLAAGAPLATHALIADALMLLRLSLQRATRPNAFPVLSRLILTPHSADAEGERNARARFELRLRRSGRHRRSVTELCDLIEGWDLRAGLPELVRLLRRMPRIPRDPDPAAAFAACLQDWGWPGESTRGPLPQRRLDRFTSLLEDLRAAGLGAGPEALDLLAQSCRESRLAERGGVLSPLQVLAPEDAVDATFDAAWIMNTDGDNWPARPVVNPLLPSDAADHVPRASPTGMLHYTRQLQSALLGIAPAVVFSWSRQSGDALRLPSPLLAGAAAAGEATTMAPPWTAFLPAGRVATGYAGHPWLEAIEDPAGLPLPAGALLPGGAGLFEAQSGCPLDAYLRHRLGAAFEPMPGPFADAAYRGTLLHAALQQLYAPQCGIPGLPPADHIDIAIEAALAAKDAARRLSAVSLAAERARLQRALREWLACESGRSGFVVGALERQVELVYGGFRIGTRIDRIDRLDDGRLLLIDYKSSRLEVSGWGQPRIASPQLPLYGVLLTEAEGLPVAGLAVAVVRSGEMEIAGIVDDPAAAAGKLAATGSGRGKLVRNFNGWEGLYRHWKSAIDALLAEVAAGEAPNRVWHRNALDYSPAVLALRRTEGEAWLAAHGAVDTVTDDD